MRTYSTILLLCVSLVLGACDTRLFSTDSTSTDSSTTSTSSTPTDSTSTSAAPTDSVTNAPHAPAVFAVPDQYAAQVVRKVFAQGGNAIDAAVAVGFSLAVTFPEAGNIGGGGFLLTRMQGDFHFLDYREKAPLAASRDMYLQKDGSVQEKASLVGIKAAAVPGTVAGLWQAHQRFGTLPWAELLAPAINYAENGFTVHPQKAAAIPDIIEWLGTEVNFSQYFGDLQNGGVFKQPALAATLRTIAAQGRDGFYQGVVAEQLITQMQRDGGLIVQQDLDQYQAVWRAPLMGDWQGYKVVTAPPPSSGGVALIQLLKMKQHLAEQFAATTHNDPQYIHLIAEMEKRVFADRAEYFGDPDFVAIPLTTLLSDDYIQRRANEVQTSTISQLANVQPGVDSPSTTHFSIIDPWGNVVSNTYTINWGYGSGVVVEQSGYLLNNEMDDFSVKAGVGNVYGVLGSTANEIQAGKRMLSSMTPTILMQGDEVRMVLGTPGGSTIFTSVFQAIVNVIKHGFSAQQAVSASRFHHQLVPADLITMSISIPLEAATIQGLQQRGYRVTEHAWEFGDIQLISRTANDTQAASDPRGIGVSGVIK